MAWAVELSEYDTYFTLKGAIKSQVLTNFLVEFTTPLEMASHFLWIFSMDDSSNLKGSRAGIVLEGRGKVLLEQSLRFNFQESNNQTKYEALLGEGITTTPRKISPNSRKMLNC